MDVSQIPAAPSWAYVVLVAVFLITAGIPTWITLAKANTTGKKVDAVHHQTQNNSGSTMKDGVDRIEEKLDEHIAHSEKRYADTLAEFEKREAALREEIARRPWWKR